MQSVLLFVLVCLVLITLADGLRFIPHKQGVNMTQSFSEVYRHRKWGNDGGGSGGGSTLNATASVRKYFNDFFIKKKIKHARFLDAPCGAMLWQPALLEDIERIVPNFHYVGMDIVPDLIKTHQERFKNHTNWKFLVGDISSTPLPAVDMIICRDVFFHLTFEKIMCAINNFSKSGSKYLFATSNPGARNHRMSVGLGLPLNEGGFRDVDLRRSPLNLPAPVDVLHEKESSRIMAVWQLPIKLFKADEDGKPLDCSV